MGRMNGTRLSLLVGEGRELTSSACLQFSIRELALMLMDLMDADVKEDGAGDTGERDVSLSSSELSDSSSSSAGVGQLLKPRHPFSFTSND